MGKNEHEKNFPNRIRMRSHQDLEATVLSLSPRERQVIDSRLNGLLSKQIAHRLHLSPRTIEDYSASLKRKMGVKTLLELLILVNRMIALGYYDPEQTARASRP